MKKLTSLYLTFRLAVRRPNPIVKSRSQMSAVMVRSKDAIVSLTVKKSIGRKIIYEIIMCKKLERIMDIGMASIGNLAFTSKFLS